MTRTEKGKILPNGPK